jgi:hypothetical protein
MYIELITHSSTDGRPGQPVAQRAGASTPPFWMMVLDLQLKAPGCGDCAPGCLELGWLAYSNRAAIPTSSLVVTGTHDVCPVSGWSVPDGHASCFADPAPGT